MISQGTRDRLHQKREAVRKALIEYERHLKVTLELVPRGSGHALNEFDSLKASITQVESAKRVLWMEND